MDPNTNTAAPVKKPTFGQRLKNMFSSKKKSTTTHETVVEEKHETKIKEKEVKHDKHLHQQDVVTVPPGPVLVPAVMIPVVGAPQENAQFIPQPAQQPVMQPPMQVTEVERQVLTEKQAFGSIIESKAIGVREELPPQPMMSGPAPIPVQQAPLPVPQPVLQAIPPPIVAPAPPPNTNRADLYQPVGGQIMPEPITHSVMGPVPPPAPVIVEQRVELMETKPLTGAGIPIESGGMVYNERVIQTNQGQYVAGQGQMAPHLRNIVEITGTQPPDLTNPRDLIIGPAVKTNPVFMENLPNLKNDPEYISRHLAENNAAKPKPFHQMQEYGKIPNPSYAGGKPFFVDMLYNPDPLVPLSQYPDSYMHVPLQLIGQKNAELAAINKMNEVQIKEHKETMRSDPYYK